MQTGYFFDQYLKNIDDDGQVNVGLVQFSRPYVFSLSGASYSMTSVNTFSHSFDYSIYPTSMSSVTGFGAFCTSGNSMSGYFYQTVMQLYNYRALASCNGTFSVTTLTSSTTSSLSNIGKYDTTRASGDVMYNSSFSAHVTGFHIFCFSKRIYGDAIMDGSVSMYSGSTLIAYDTVGYDGSPVYSLTSSFYDTSSTSNIIRFWVVPDNGKIVVWSSCASTLNSFSAITQIKFANSVGVTNYTFDLRVGRSEFNNSENASFYDNDFNTGKVPTPWITGLGIYSPQNELLIMCKLQKPIKKTDLPLTFRISLDRM